MAKIQIKAMPYKNFTPHLAYEVSEEEAASAIADGAAMPLEDHPGVIVQPHPGPWPIEEKPADEVPAGEEDPDGEKEIDDPIFPPDGDEITPPADDVPADDEITPPADDVPAPEYLLSDGSELEQ
jgi:hypothetical protein